MILVHVGFQNRRGFSKWLDSRREQMWHHDSHPQCTLASSNQTVQFVGRDKPLASGLHNADVCTKPLTQNKHSHLNYTFALTIRRRINVQGLNRISAWAFRPVFGWVRLLPRHYFNFWELGTMVQLWPWIRGQNKFVRQSLSVSPLYAVKK